MGTDDGEFVRRVKEADEVEVRGSSLVPTDTLYLLTPEPLFPGAPPKPLMVLCAPSREVEVGAAVRGLRVTALLDRIVAATERPKEDDRG